jgi:hypothetical protein
MSHFQLADNILVSLQGICVHSILNNCVGYSTFLLGKDQRVEDPKIVRQKLSIDRMPATSAVVAVKV